NDNRRLVLEDTVIKYAGLEQTADEIINLINSDRLITAACFVNDDIAAQVMGKLQSKGIRIPDQLSITGFDNIRFSQASLPPITTLHTDRKQLGIEGAKAILRRIQEPSSPVRKLLFPSTLIKRDSVKSPARTPR
ncbi:MAG: substrate-binding domain-containing protein, partial [Candidatus Marinimicrobia bacterium]|nr:substrate-binding domain-containing protein [Candidatus Neomarinimicrobiota bacterium]